MRRRDDLELTVSEDGPSDSVLPASLVIHSCVLSPPMLSAVTPGTTRGMLLVRCRGRVDVVLKVRCSGLVKCDVPLNRLRVGCMGLQVGLEVAKALAYKPCCLGLPARCWR
jgi:hypothetical protein